MHQSLIKKKKKKKKKKETSQTLYYTPPLQHKVFFPILEEQKIFGKRQIELRSLATILILFLYVPLFSYKSVKFPLEADKHLTLSPLSF